MNIKLTTEKRIVIKPEEAKLIKEVTVNSINDNYTMKRITAITKEAGSILLWSGSEYDAIGQWTDTDVVNRINEILNN
jgi:hypothetical protein